MLSNIILEVVILKRVNSRSFFREQYTYRFLHKCFNMFFRSKSRQKHWLFIKEFLIMLLDSYFFILDPHAGQTIFLCCVPQVTQWYVNLLLPNLVARDIPKSIMLNTFSLAYMVIKMTVPNMVRKENGKGIM